MAWNDKPSVRELGKYADGQNFKGVVALCFKGDGQFEVVSYGKTALICGSSKKVNEQIFDLVSSGQLDIPDDLF